MAKGTWAVISAAVLLSGSILIAADEAGPGAAPATQPAHHMGRARLIKPYSEMTDLTDDQKEKIEKIHADELAQENELKAKEEADIEALLTDDQKVELKALKKPQKPRKDKGPTTKSAT